MNLDPLTLADVFILVVAVVCVALLAVIVARAQSASKPPARRGVMVIRQHIPNFVSGVDPQSVGFDTLEQLLAIDFVDRFRFRDLSLDFVAAHPNTKFSRFSLSHYAGETWLMIAEYAEGRHWWVVGYITSPTPEIITGLPEWHNPTTP